MRVLVLCVIVLAACGSDNASIRDSDDVFRYDGWSEVGWNEHHRRLTFTNMTRHRKMTWVGDIDDALNHLGHLDVEQCYRHPLERPEPVPCG